MDTDGNSSFWSGSIRLSLPDHPLFSLILAFMPQNIKSNAEHKAVILLVTFEEILKYEGVIAIPYASLLIIQRRVTRYLISFLQSSQ
jgi:hypothetical protein